MKRRKKHVWLIVYPFEYPVLQAYLNDMAEKGWKLVSLKGDRSCWLTFEADASQKEYYLVDYTKDYSMIIPDSETADAHKYRTFVEEFGYMFVGSNGPLMVYRCDDPNLTLREGTQEDRRIMNMSMHKTAVWLFISWALYVLLLLQSYHGLLWSMYADGSQFQNFLLMAALNITWLIHLLPYFIWLVRRRNMTSSKMLLRQSRIVYGSVVLLICMLIGSLFTVNVLYVIAFTVIFLVFGWLIYRFWKTRYPMGFKVIGSIALLWVTFAIGVNITLTSTYDSLSFQKPMEQTRLSDFVLQHVNTAGLTLDSYSESSILSEHMSFSAYSEKEDAADKNLYIDWYRIRDGFFRDWTKRRYQSEDGMEQMCRGYGEPIKTQGVTMYKGEYEVLFIRDDTYVCINDDFLLDDDGWKLIHELLNL